MKKIPTIIKFPFLIVINIFVFALDIIFYTNGLMDNLLLFLPISALLTCLNYWLCDKTVFLIIIQSLSGFSCLASVLVSMFLYMKNISSDSAGILVGILLTLGQVSIFSYISIAAVLIKNRKINKKQNEVLFKEIVFDNKNP